MRVAITGAAGLFGQGLARVFEERHQVFRLTRAEADITWAEQVRAAIAERRPEVVIHSAAIPDLEICESEPERAFQVNVEGTRNVVAAAREVGAGVVFISTDAVFDGRKTAPYRESDPTDPPTVYGRTKVEAEKIVRELPRHWVFRVPVLFGPGKANFVEKAVRKLRAEESYEVAADQVGGAAYTLDAGRKIMEVVEAGRHGLYHLSNQGVCSRYELACRAAELAGLDPGLVVGKPAAEMGRRAPRLKYSVMELEALRQTGFAWPRPWPEALADYIETFLKES